MRSVFLVAVCFLNAVSLALGFSTATGDLAQTAGADSSVGGYFPLEVGTRWCVAEYNRFTALYNYYEMWIARDTVLPDGKSYAELVKFDIESVYVSNASYRREGSKVIEYPDKITLDFAWQSGDTIDLGAGGGGKWAIDVSLDAQGRRVYKLYQYGSWYSSDRTFVDSLGFKVLDNYVAYQTYNFHPVVGWVIRGDTTGRVYSVRKQPTPIQPHGGAVVDPLRVELTWSMHPSALYYQLDVGKDPALNNWDYQTYYPGYGASPAETTLILLSLDPDTVYYWRLQAWYPDRFAGRTSVSSFRTFARTGAGFFPLDHGTEWCVGETVSGGGLTSYTMMRVERDTVLSDNNSYAEVVTRDLDSVIVATNFLRRNGQRILEYPDRILLDFFWHQGQIVDWSGGVTLGAAKIQGSYPLNILLDSAGRRVYRIGDPAGYVEFVDSLGFSVLVSSSYQFGTQRRVAGRVINGNRAGKLYEPRSVPSPIRPEVGARANPENVQVSWSCNPNALYYQVDVGRDSSFLAGSFGSYYTNQALASAETTLYLPVLNDNAWYYWRVRAVYPVLSPGRYSFVSRFSTWPPIPGNFPLGLGTQWCVGDNSRGNGLRRYFMMRIERQVTLPDGRTYNELVTRDLDSNVLASSCLRQEGERVIEYPDKVLLDFAWKSGDTADWSDGIILGFTEIRGRFVVAVTEDAAGHRIYRLAFSGGDSVFVQFIDNFGFSVLRSTGRFADARGLIVVGLVVDGVGMGTVFDLQSGPLPLVPKVQVNATNGIVRFAWKPNANAQYYQCEVTSDPTFSRINKLISSHGSDTAVKMDGFALPSAVYWRVRAVYPEESPGSYSPVASFRLTLIPAEFAVSRNYPNPFNGKTMIKIDLPAEGHLSVQLFDPLGRKVADLFEEDLPGGVFVRSIDASNYPSGVYFLRVRWRGLSQTKGIILAR